MPQPNDDQLSNLEVYGVDIVGQSQAGENLLQKVSAGLALRGILVSKNEEDILHEKLSLITVQENVDLTYPSNKGIYDKTEQFSSQVRESTFREAIKKFGASVKGSVEGNSLFKGVVDLSASGSFNKDEEYITETNQKSESRYYSKLQYVVVPTAACILNPNQIRLDRNALQELKRIDMILRNPDSTNIATHACQDFLKKYGSHALVGNITFGGIYLISASCSEFTTFEEEKIKNVVSQKITTQLELNVTGMGGGKLNTSHSSDTTSDRTHEQISMESRIILETTKIGGSEQASDLESWKNRLIQDSSKWAVIDRDYSGTIAVWDIICRHHVNEFEDAKQLTEMLHNEWMKISSLKTKFWYFVDNVALVNEKVNLLITQKIPQWFQSQQITTQNLNYLVELRKEIESKTKDTNYWVQKVLSIKIVQEYLLSFSNNDRGAEIQDLMNQLLTREDAIAISRKESSQLDYSKLKDILNWLDEVPEFIRNHNSANDVNDVESLIKKTSGFINSLVNEHESARLNLEQKLCTSLEYVIINYRLTLKQQDELSELYLLGLLLPLGYIPNLNIFKPSLKLEDYRKLETSLRENKDYPFGIEAKDSPLEKREARLVFQICQILTSGYSDFDKPKIINFFNDTVYPKLQSPSVLKVLDRYTLGYSSECLEAIKELQYIINDVKNNMKPKTNIQNWLSKFNPFRKDSDLDDSMNSPSVPDIETKKSFQKPSPVLDKILKELELTKYYPDKLGREEVYSITEYSLEQHKPKTKKQLVTHFLTNLISFNYSGRSLRIISEKASSNNRKPWEKSGGIGNSSDQELNLHSLDVVAAIFLCCNPIIRQDFVQRLWGCKLAIPLVIQDGSDKAPKFFLWAMRSLVMEWVTQQGDKEQEIATYPVETISFIRFGESEPSKSKLLNWVISGKNSQIFFNRESEGYRKNRQLANGMIEVAWYLPTNTNVENHFQDIALFTNLRGDARDYPIQLKLIHEISSKIVIFISAQELKQETEIIRSFLKSGKGVIIYLTGKIVDWSLAEDFDKSLPQEYGKNIQFLDTKDKDSQDISKEIRTYFENLKTNKALKISLEKAAQSMLKQGMDVDEYEEVCQKGIAQAANILEIIQKYRNKDRKNKIIPLQGKLWSDWAENDKEFQRMKGFQQWKRERAKDLKDDDETYKSELSKRMKRCREDQYEKFKNSDSEAMQLFLKIMIEESTLVKEYFTRYLKLKLDELSRQEVPKLLQSSKEIRSQIEKIKKRIKEISPDASKTSSEVKNLLEQQRSLAKEQDSLFTRISDQSLGLEHFLREMGQIYEAYKALGNHENEDKSEINPSYLPKVAAKLVLSGYPLEIMDGDVSSVPIVWVEAVFKELNQLLSDSNEQKEPKILTLSTLGMQSSGKSTLLNTMFGLQFAVSAGRCTRGVYLQPVKVEKELRKKLNTDYIFVVDTEGLNSFSHGYEHDNELSTFVIGLTSLTLIVIMKENRKYLEELLPISVLAFLRMEQQGLQRKCKLVHNHIDETDRKRLITEIEILEGELNKSTHEACKIEKVPSRDFKSLIGFDVEEDVEYIPTLSEGDGPMVAVNPRYSETINKLKKRIISKDNLPKSSINNFGKHLLDFWGAVKKDPFAYGFKDIIETQASTLLDKTISIIKWDFKVEITTNFVSNARTSIGNCQSTENLDETFDKLKQAFANLDETFDKLKQELKEATSSFLITQESKLDSFFENMEIEDSPYKKYIMERKFRTFQELRDLSEKLRRDTEQKIKEFYETQKTKLKSIDIKDNFRKKIYAKIKEFVEDKKKSRRDGLSWSGEEQKALFEQIWTSIVKEITEEIPNSESQKEANVRFDAWNTLKFDVYENNRNLDILKSSNDLINHDLPFSVKDTIKKLKKEDEKSIQIFFNKLYNDIDENLETKIRNRVPYNENYLTEILKDIQAKIAENNENSNKRDTLKIEKKLEISFAVSICGRSIKKLETIDQNFRSDNDFILNLKKNKPSYEDIFVSLLDETQAKVKATTKLGDIIVEGIYQEIDENLVNSIRTKMQDSPNFNIFAHKNVLLARIMICLAEEENFEYYMLYIHNFEKSLKYWLFKFFDEFIFKDAARIRDVINSEINLFVNSIKNIVNDIKDAPNIEAWTAKFHEKAKNKIIINNLDQVNIMGSVIKDFDCVALKNDLTQLLDDAKLILDSTLSRNFINEYETKKKSFVSGISKDIIGCTETCPFCGEICRYGTHTTDLHKHEVLSHRPIGITGYRPAEGVHKKLITSTCQQRVISDQKFRNKDTNNEFIFYKDYHKLYPSWIIQGDAGGKSSTYWIWFMIKFSHELADYYTDSDDKIEEPDIPDYWKEMNLTKEKEIEKLWKVIEGRA